jgi:hypothetical protein
LLGSLLKEIANTLFSDTQTYNEKVDSLQLLLFLKKQEFARNYAWNDYYFELKQKKSIVEKGYSGFFDQGSSLLLRLHLTFLQIAFEEDCLQDILEILALINNGKNSEIIDSLRAVIDFLKSEKDNLVVSPVITVLVQYISVFCFHTNSDVRFWTVRALYQLIDTQYADFVIGRLSKMMDDDSFDVKWAIVEQALLIKQHNPATFSYIIGKAQIDNNYLVRISVKKHIEEMQHGGE